MRKGTKVVTGVVRLSYVSIFKAKQFGEGQDAKYSLCLLIPKKDKKTIREIEEAIEAAKELGKDSKWGGKIPKNLKTPLRDPDEEDERDGAEYENMLFMNASSKRRPGIVDENCEEILDADEVYSGCYGRVSLNFYAFNSNGNKGVAVGLNNVQKLQDGDKLGGDTEAAEAEFAEAEEVDFSFILG